MITLIKAGWNRFRSAVPPVVKKIQILLTMASGTLGTLAAISWPGKTVIIGSVCGYGAAGCLGAVAVLQFFQQAATIIETKTEVTITQKTTVTPLNDQQNG